MLQPLGHHITAAFNGKPWENSGWKQDACSQAVNHCSHPQGCTLRRLRMEKLRILGPDSWEAYQRNEFHEFQLLHPPRPSPLHTHSKVLKSLTRDIWFSSTNSNPLMVQWPGVLLQKLSRYHDLPPCLFETVLSVIWDAVYWTWNVQEVHQIKHNSQLLGCAFFFQLT